MLVLYFLWTRITRISSCFGHLCYFHIFSLAKNILVPSSLGKRARKQEGDVLQEMCPAALRSHCGVIRHEFLPSGGVCLPVCVLSLCSRWGQASSHRSTDLSGEERELNQRNPHRDSTDQFHWKGGCKTAWFVTSTMNGIQVLNVLLVSSIQL